MSDNLIFPIFRKPEDHPKKWGKEIWLANNNKYCGKLLYFNKGAKFSAHFHDLKNESFFILKGTIKFMWQNLLNADQNESILSEGNVIDIPRLCVHQVEALEESVIIEISTTHYENDSFRIRKGDNQI